MAGKGRNLAREYVSTASLKLRKFTKLSEHLQAQQEFPKRPFIYGFLSGLKPDDDVPLIDWAEKNRVLTSEASAEPGRYRTEKTPYIREILNCLSSSSSAEKVVFMKAAQVGATEAGSTWLGYVLDKAPGPSLVVQPNGEMLKTWVRQRLNPMIESTASLKEIKDATKSDMPQSTQMKMFANGASIIMSSAGSSRGLSSMPIRYLILDEVDRYPENVNDEGDPCELAIKRTVTFKNRKILIISTPTIRGASKIEAEFNASDQRKYHIFCPFCGYDQELIFEFLKWSIDENGNVADVHLQCQQCSEPIREYHKPSLLSGGYWKCENPDAKVAGFQLSGLYSPWMSWTTIAERWERASRENDINLLRVIVNTDLGIPWEDKIEKALPEGMIRRCEAYGATISDKALCIVAGVDVQDNSLHINTMAFGVGEESWGIEYKIIHGHHDNIETWKALDDYLFNSVFSTESGIKMKILRTCIDTGSFTDAVYRYVKPREGKGVIAIKGSSTPGRGIISLRPSKQKYSVNLYMVGTTAAKDLIFHRLRNFENGTPGYIHFNMSYDEAFFKELLGEKIVRKKIGGRYVRTYEQINQNQRVEGLDCTVYAHAALRLLNPNYQILHEKRKHVLSEIEKQNVEKKEAIIEKKMPILQSTQSITLEEEQALFNSKHQEAKGKEIPVQIAREEHKFKHRGKRRGFLWSGWQRRY